MSKTDNISIVNLCMFYFCDFVIFELVQACYNFPWIFYMLVKPYTFRDYYFPASGQTERIPCL